MRDILITVSGSQVDGIKAPHKNAEPRHTTLAIPVIALLLLERLEIRSAKVREANVNIKAFMVYINPLNEITVSGKRIIPKIMNSSQTIIEYRKLAFKINLLWVL